MVPESSRFESLETFLQTFLLHPLNRGGKADFFVEITISNSPKAA